MISSSRAGASRTDDNRARIPGFQSGMAVSCDEAYGLDKCCPGLALTSQNFPALRCQPVDAPTTLARLLDPHSLDPRALFEPIEQGIERVDVKGERATGSRADQLAQVV